MKHTIEQLIRLRNPGFLLTEKSAADCCFRFLSYSVQLLRGLKLVLYNRYAKGIALGRGVRFFYVSNMRLGRFVKIGEFTTLNATGKGCLEIGKGSGIGAFSRVIISTSFNHLGSHIHIGENVGIGEYAYLGGGGGLDIGDDCIVGQYFPVIRKIICMMIRKCWFASKEWHAKESASEKIAGLVLKLLCLTESTWWQLCNCRRSSGEQIYASELCHWWSSGTSFKIKNWWNGKHTESAGILVKEFPSMKKIILCHSICSESDQRFRRRNGLEFHLSDRTIQ